jgi:hypothetical protein
MKTKLLKRIRQRFIIQIKVKIPGQKYPNPIPVYILSDKKTHEIKEYLMSEYDEMIKYILQKLLGAGDGYSQGAGIKYLTRNRQKRTYNIQVRKTKLNGAYKII